MKRLFSIFLILSMCLGLFSCGKSEEVTTDEKETESIIESESETEGASESETESITLLDIVKDGKSSCRVEFSFSDKLGKDCAFVLIDTIASLTGANLNVGKYEDNDKLKIVIGNADPNDGIDHESLGGADFVIKVNDKKIYIAAATDYGYNLAFDYLLEVLNTKETINGTEKMSEIKIKTPMEYKGGIDISMENTLASGASYAAEGYEKKSGNIYTIKDSMTFKFADPIGKDMNGYRVSYYATSEVSAEIKYTVNNKTITETLYLEDTERSFFSLIETDAFLAGKYGEGIYELTVKPLRNMSVDFVLKDITTEKRKVPEKTVYIQNEKFKLGVLLEWGGGISYLEDLTDGNPEITNLLNRCDTGRLVQQSYYGTNEPPYECAYYGETKWGYNPVQGGDQYGNNSKIVDFSISEDGKSIYIKCQPLDWAKNCSYTPSYMENVYTLLYNSVYVQNKFTDYSGYTHKASHQELPAFYTISHLGNFVYYNGTNQWTGDELTKESDLPFWTTASAYHYMNSKENWCAWVNDNDYGVGVFTPRADILLAGRHMYNGSTSPSDTATNYVAPLITHKIESYGTFSYNYWITAGDISDIRDTFFAVYKGAK